MPIPAKKHKNNFEQKNNVPKKHKNNFEQKNNVPKQKNNNV